MLSERYSGWTAKGIFFGHTDFSSSETGTVLDVVRKMRHFRPIYGPREKFK
jgi:hypothetical protein